MPWQSFAAFTDDDVAAIFAYLKASKPIKNIEPAPKQLSEL
jgi:cytochrome c553